MASVNFEKYKSAQSVKAVVKHCDKEQRQLTENHSNQDINKNMSCKNLQYSNTNYKSTCKRFDDRIAFLDTLENQKTEFYVLVLKFLALLTCQLIKKLTG